jgi:VIT1/CCC1 family predicted Fe2+/Mn2+ transporter
MKARAEKLKRLVAVQRHLERMAESELAETSRQRAALAETIEVVVDAMGSAHPMHRMFSGHYASQLGRLVQKDQMLLGIQQVHESRMLKERAKGDRLEESMKDARLSEEREAADNTILDLIDQHVAVDPPASRKVDGR